MRDALTEMDLAATRFRAAGKFRTGYLHSEAPARPRVWRQDRMRWAAIDLSRGIRQLPVAPVVQVPECRHTPCAHGVAEYGPIEQMKHPEVDADARFGPGPRGTPRRAPRARSAPNPPPSSGEILPGEIMGPAATALAAAWEEWAYHGDCRTHYPAPTCTCGYYRIMWVEDQTEWAKAVVAAARAVGLGNVHVRPGGVA